MGVRDAAPSPTARAAGSSAGRHCGSSALPAGGRPRLRYVLGEKGFVLHVLGQVPAVAQVGMCGTYSMECGGLSRCRRLLPQTKRRHV